MALLRAAGSHNGVRPGAVAEGRGGHGARFGRVRPGHVLRYGSIHPPAGGHRRGDTCSEPPDRTGLGRDDDRLPRAAGRPDRVRRVGRRAARGLRPWHGRRAVRLPLPHARPGRGRLPRGHHGPARSRRQRRQFRRVRRRRRRKRPDRARRTPRGGSGAGRQLDGRRRPPPGRRRRRRTASRASS